MQQTGSTLGLRRALASIALIIFGVVAGYLLAAKSTSGDSATLNTPVESHEGSGESARVRQLERELARAQRALAVAQRAVEHPSTSPTDPATHVPPSQPTDTPPEPEIVRLPGTLVGSAVFNAQVGTWQWPQGRINPDLGQSGGSEPLSLAGCWFDAQTGRLSVSVGEPLDAELVQFTGVTVAVDNGDLGSTRLVERFEHSETGLSVIEAAGTMSGIAAALNDPAREPPPANESETIVSQTSFRFALRGVKYTLHVRVSYGRTGAVSAVEFLDGT